MSIHCGNYRQIIDMNYRRSSYYIIDSGISENIFEDNYDNQMKLHSEGNYISMQSGYHNLK